MSCLNMLLAADAAARGFHCRQYLGFDSLEEYHMGRCNANNSPFDCRPPNIDQVTICCLLLSLLHILLTTGQDNFALHYGRLQVGRPLLANAAA